MDIADEIKRLHELHQSGALTDAEFAQAKARLISSGSSSSHNSHNLNQFRRSKTDQWLGGICGGLGNFTGVDSWVWRLLFALLALCAFSGVVIYILAWIFVPEEE